MVLGGYACRILKIRGTESQAKQGVYQKRRNQVDSQIDYMKTDDIESAKMVVKGKCQEAEIPVRQKFISAAVGIEVCQVFNNFIAKN